MLVHGNPRIIIGGGINFSPGRRPNAAKALLGTEPNGLAVDFTDNSYAIRTTSDEPPPGAGE